MELGKVQIQEIYLTINNFLTAAQRKKRIRVATEVFSLDSYEEMNSEKTSSVNFVNVRFEAILRNLN